MESVQRSPTQRPSSVMNSWVILAFLHFSDCSNWQQGPHNFSSQELRQRQNSQCTKLALPAISRSYSHENFSQVVKLNACDLPMKKQANSSAVSHAKCKLKSTLQVSSLCFGLINRSGSIPSRQPIDTPKEEPDSRATALPRKRSGYQKECWKIKLPSKMASMGNQLSL